MKRVLIYTLSVLFLAVAGLGVITNAGESACPPGQGAYDGRGRDSEVREIEMERARAAQDPDELKRREYIPPYMEGSSGTVLGTVTLVGDRVMRMVESGTGIEYEIILTEAQQKELTTGFNISAELINGRLVSFAEEGVPPDLEKIVYSAEDLPTDNMLEQQKAF